MQYLKLIKWRLSLAVAFSASAGFFLSAGALSLRGLVCFSGVFLMAGGAAALNQIQERKLDSLMYRTASRPIPAHQITVFEAILFTGLCLMTGSILLFRLGWLPGLLGLSNIVFYNLLYTPLKKISPYAILPGAIVGAVPPMIGWTAAGGSLTHPNIIYLATLLFLWQIPHFWLLVIRHGKDYEKAGFKPISLYLDDRQIKRLVFTWILISSVFLSSYPLFGIQLGIIPALIIIVLNIILITAFYQYLFKMTDQPSTKKAFILMNVFLILVLSLIVITSLV